MKTITSIVFCGLLAYRALDAQNADNENPQSQLTLSVSLNTNVAIIGSSVLTLYVKVRNSSSNDAYASQTEGVELYLTNRSGHLYQLPAVVRLETERLRHLPRRIPISAG